MQILLPPSEGKAHPARGAALDLASLAFPELTPAREAALDALITLSAGDEDAALATLGLSGGQRDEVRRNTLLRTAPATTAAKLYTGVLYDALDLATLPPAAKRRATAQILIFSGLFGVSRLGDRLPAYRCGMNVKLSPLGVMSGHWRRALPEIMSGLGGPVLDLRSSSYAAAWRPSGDQTTNVATVRVLHERVIGGEITRSVVSHFNKATKGRVVRDLLLSGAAPRSVPALVTALRDLKYMVEEPAPGALDVVVREL
ncbi:peroxide stress protein YaaA [Catenuloplanes japonicus]|uniref:peroxide stress protein YaaA n=1 Tax=Catenuloplanes japonicus TaxID=33876 RepID=UPI000524516F|nr:peroxide stress protein YaaA [Catenuloplanes japonicus]